MLEPCEHKDFTAHVEVNRLEDISSFAADVRITCAECGTRFRFLGLPGGLNIEGATVSFDGTEARLAIEPERKGIHPLRGFTGFYVKENYGD